MKTIDERLQELAAFAADQANTFHQMMLHAGPFQGIRKAENGSCWAVFEDSEEGAADIIEVCVQDILDLAKMLSREKQL
jgi:hypothetical protein